MRLLNDCITSHTLSPIPILGCPNAVKQDESNAAVPRSACMKERHHNHHSLIAGPTHTLRTNNMHTEQQEHRPDTTWTSITLLLLPPQSSAKHSPFNAIFPSIHIAMRKTLFFIFSPAVVRPQTSQSQDAVSQLHACASAPSNRPAAFSHLH